MSKTVYILGAGASHEFSSGKFPLTDGLSEILLHDISELQQYKTERNIKTKDIELLLSYLDLEIAYYKREAKDFSHFSEIRNKVIKKIINILETKNADINNSLDLFIAKKVEAKTTFITTNYDCLLEYKLWGMKRWSPKNGYSKYLENILLNGSVPDNDSLESIEVLKVHGSINFVKGGLFSLDNDLQNEFIVTLEMSERFFPGCAMELGYVNQYVVGDHLLVPSYIKDYSYSSTQFLWNLAASRMSAAEKIVLFGTSLREEDSMLNFIFSFANWSAAKFVIINKNPTEIQKKLLKLNRSFRVEGDDMFDSLEKYIKS